MPHLAKAQTLAAGNLAKNLRPSAGQRQVKAHDILAEFRRQVGPHGQWTVLDRPALPDNAKLARPQHALLHHGAEIAAGKTARRIAGARAPGHRRIILPLQHGNHRLLMPAAEADPAEILAAFHPDASAAQLKAGNEIARGGVGVSPCQAAPPHLLKAGDATIGTDDDHRDIAGGTIIALNGDQRQDGAIGIEPGAGIGRGPLGRIFNLPRTQRLLHPGIIGSRHQPHRHPEGLLQQVAQRVVAGQPVALIFAAGQAHTDLRHLLGPGPTAGFGQAVLALGTAPRPPFFRPGGAGDHACGTQRRHQDATPGPAAHPISSAGGALPLPRGADRQ